MMEKEKYELFVEDWQDEYGPRPSECIPEIDSNDFKLWLEENEKF